MKHFAPPLHYAVADRSSVSFQKIGHSILVASVIMVFVCLLRELYIDAFGKAAVLGELKQFAAYDEPQSILNWITSVSLFLSSILIASIFSFSRTLPNPTKTRWNVLAAALAAISIDKVVNAHQLALGWLWRGGDAEQHIAQWIALAPALALSLYLSPILRDLPRRTALRFVACGCGLLFGAIVLDGVSSHFAIKLGFHSLAYRGTAFLEEAFEAISSAAFCATLTGYIDQRSIRLEN